MGAQVHVVAVGSPAGGPVLLRRKHPSGAQQPRALVLIADLCEEYLPGSVRGLAPGSVPIKEGLQGFRLGGLRA